MIVSLTKTTTYEAQRLFPNDENKCMFSCAYCGRQRMIVIPKAYLNKTVRIKCYCKHAIPVLFVGRKHYRKDVNLPGELRDINGLKRVIVIKDISESGIGVSLGNSKHNINVGDILRVKFQLDNQAFTMMDVSVIVKRIHNNIAGCQFQFLEQHDKKQLGFYMRI